MNPRFHELILKHFIIGKFNLNESEIIVTFHDEDVDFKFTHISIKNGPMFANGYNETLFTVQQFGHVFSQMKIAFQSGSLQSAAEISQYINKYCSAAIQSITLYRGAVDSYFDDVEYSFGNATEVYLRHNYNSQSFIDIVRLDRIFPQMQKLNIDYFNELQYIANHYPHLTEFYLRPPSDKVDFEKLHQFFMLNPQLSNLSTPLYKNFTHLSNINANLPNLQTLSLETLNLRSYISPFDTNEIIYFDNVKHLLLKLTTYDEGWIVGLRAKLSLLQFKVLKTFTVTTNVLNSVEHIIALIVRNKELNNLSMEKFELTYKQLRELFEALPQLEEITIGWKTQETLHDLNRFLLNATGSRLRIINVHLSQRLQIENVLRIVPNEWKWDIGSRQMLRIERIN